MHAVTSTPIPEQVLEDLHAMPGVAKVLSDPAELSVYETDGFTLARGRPAAVVFPGTSESVGHVVALLARHGIDVMPRGSGTGLTGGTVPTDPRRPAVIVSTTKLDQIHHIDLASRTARCGAGVRNTALSDAVARLPGGERFHFAPDPSSQRASTLGGNAATNAGGIHVLKDFVTSSHVQAVTICDGEGTLIELSTAGGFDLVGLACGSEGTLGLIVEVVVKLSPKRTDFRTIVATFPTQVDACDAVSDIIASGHLPAAMEMLDGAMVNVVEKVFQLGIDPSAGAMLLIELDDAAPLLDRNLEAVVDLIRGRNALTCETASDVARKNELWGARKKAFGAIGRISPSYCTQDACVPRSRLAEVLTRIGEIGQSRGLVINNVFHAGDGNVHPIFLYDDKNDAQVANVLEAAEEVLAACIDFGGTITGEHGVGLEKLSMMPRLFDQTTLNMFHRTKRAFDPRGRFNAGKLLPPLSGEIPKPTHPGRKSPQ
jgi:glycolate oxidase